MNQYPNFKEEKKLWKQGYECVVGLDEAGRGPLAGPVVAAAVTINPKHEIRNPRQILNSKNKNSKAVSNFDIRISDLNVCDSKQLSEKSREELYEILTRHGGISWGIGVVSEKVIDKINILQATKLAMQKAAKNLRGDFLLLDGNFSLPIKTPQKSIIKGDAKVFSIAAASIIAKVTRDRIMRQMDKKYPAYNFAQHKGYGTAVHVANIEKFGPCPIHRKSFYPVSNFI